MGQRKSGPSSSRQPPLVGGTPPLPRSFTNPPTRTAITATIRPRRSAFMAGSVGLDLAERSRTASARSQRAPRNRLSTLCRSPGEARHRDDRYRSSGFAGTLSGLGTGRRRCRGASPVDDPGELHETIAEVLGAGAVGHAPAVGHAGAVGREARAAAATGVEGASATAVADEEAAASSATAATVGAVHVIRAVGDAGEPVPRNAHTLTPDTRKPSSFRDMATSVLRRPNNALPAASAGRP